MKLCLLKKLFTKSTLRKSEKFKGGKLQGAENLKKQVLGPLYLPHLNFFQFSEGTFRKQLFILFFLLQRSHLAIKQFENINLERFRSLEMKSENFLNMYSDILFRSQDALTTYHFLIICQITWLERQSRTVFWFITIHFSTSLLR